MSNYNYVYSESVVSTSTVMAELIASEFPEAKLLNSGFTGSVYELSSSKVIKTLAQSDFDCGLLAMWETASGFEVAEVLAMKWANNVNNLVVKFVDHIHVEDMGHIIAMERLFPCLVTAFSREDIEAAIVVAEAELEQLWASGWAHGDLRRPSIVMKGDLPIDVLYNNIMLVQGDDKQCVIRLIDTGFAALEQYDLDDCIDVWISKDREDWRLFKEWILNYPRS